MSTIRWGIIGCGQVTEVKSGPAFQKVEGSELVAVMRRDAAKAADYARRHNVPRWYADADQLIGDPDVNAIYVATPPAFHMTYTLRAAQAGKPVYVEKPMGRTYDECRRMIEACEQAGVPLFVAYYRRRLPTFLKVKEWIDQGLLGDLRFVSVHLCRTPPDVQLEATNLPWRFQPELAGGGLFFDLGSHQLDLLDYLCGPIAAAHGLVDNQAGLYPAEDIVCAHFTFASGLVGSGLWCFTVHKGATADRIEIVGNRGTISFPAFAPQPIRLQTESGVQELLIPYPPHVQQPLIQTVVDALRGRGSCPSTGESAARTNRVMDEVFKEWHTEQWRANNDRNDPTLL